MQDIIKDAYQTYIKKPTEQNLLNLRTLTRESTVFQAQTLTIEIMGLLYEIQGGSIGQQYTQEDVDVLERIKVLLDEHMY